MLVLLHCKMDKKIRINIQVGEARYPLWVEPKEEPIYREAARMVNRRLIAYATKFHDSYLSQETLLAMTVLDIAVLNRRQEMTTNALATEANLESIITDLEAFIGSEPASQGS